MKKTNGMLNQLRLAQSPLLHSQKGAGSSGQGTPMRRICEAYKVLAELADTLRKKEKAK
jgi:hypothetical protein